MRMWTSTYHRIRADIKGRMVEQIKASAELGDMSNKPFVNEAADNQAESILDEFERLADKYNEPVLHVRRLPKSGGFH